MSKRQQFSWRDPYFLPKLSVTFFGLLMVYVFVFHVQIGGPSKASWWIRNISYIKDDIARNIDTPRIIVISGSSSLFGIDSRILSAALDKEVVNLSANYPLGLEKIIHMLDKHVRQGDTILLPMESYYYRDPHPTFENAINDSLAMGKAYFYGLPLERQLAIFANTPPSRVMRGFANSIIEPDGIERKAITPDQVLREIKRVWSEDRIYWRGFVFESLNKHGDMLSTEPTKQYVYRRYDKGIPYFGRRLKVSPAFLEGYDRIQKIIDSRGANLYLTWPTTIRNKKFDLSTERSQAAIQNIISQLDAKKIQIYCNPALFQFSPEFFFDTVDHLNKVGAQLRSENLAECMSEIDKNLFSGQGGYETAIARVLRQEAEAQPLLTQLKPIGAM